jgi:hypothetical protein
VPADPPDRPAHLRSGSSDDRVDARQEALVTLVAAARGGPVVGIDEAPDAEPAEEIAPAEPETCPSVPPVRRPAR